MRNKTGQFYCQKCVRVNSNYVSEHLSLSSVSLVLKYAVRRASPMRENQSDDESFHWINCFTCLNSVKMKTEMVEKFLQDKSARMIYNNRDIFSTHQRTLM